MSYNNTADDMDGIELMEEDSLKDKYLTFKVADEDYAVDVRYVIEIIGIQKITQLPDMPDFLKGVINLRGKVIPVIDIRLRFRLPELEYGNRTCIIVVSFKEIYFGIVVDTVSEVVVIPEETLTKPPSSGSMRNQYLKNIGKIDEQVKIIINIEKLLSEEEINNITNI